MFVFQGSSGRFTVAVQTVGNNVRASFALCGPRDQFVRRVGFHRVSGLLSARPGTAGVLELGTYDGDNVYRDVVKPIFGRLDAANKSWCRTTARRVEYITDSIRAGFETAMANRTLAATAGQAS